MGPGLHQLPNGFAGQVLGRALRIHLLLSCIKSPFAEGKSDWLLGWLLRGPQTSARHHEFHCSCSFSMAAVTNTHKLGGWKQQKHAYSSVGSDSHGNQVKLPTGLHFFLEATRERIHSLASPASRG